MKSFSVKLFCMCFIFCFYSALSFFMSFCDTWFLITSNLECIAIKGIFFIFIINLSLDIDFEQVISPGNIPIDFEQVISPGWVPMKQKLKTVIFKMLENSKQTIALQSLLIIFSGLAKTNQTTNIFLEIFWKLILRPHSNACL